jgi:hypothetical protein
MHDSQNSDHGKYEPSPQDDAQSFEDKNELPLKSYYYDDSTGYEIYREESETDEQVDNDDGELRPEASKRIP